MQHADLRDLDLDEPIPAERLVPPGQADPEAALASRYVNFYDLAVRERLLLRRMIQRWLMTGHGMAVGTVEQVADQMQMWFTTAGCDGFVISPPYMPEGFDDVCGKLVPELRRRGLFRSEYKGTTSRETLGLPRPGGRRDPEGYQEIVK